MDVQKGNQWAPRSHVHDEGLCRGSEELLQSDGCVGAALAHAHCAAGLWHEAPCDLAHCHPGELEGHLKLLVLDQLRGSGCECVHQYSRTQNGQVDQRSAGEGDVVCSDAEGRGRDLCLARDVRGCEGHDEERRCGPRHATTAGSQAQTGPPAWKGRCAELARLRSQKP